MDEDFAAWRALLLVQHGVVRAIEAELAEAGEIGLSWYDVLLELNAAPDRRLRMQDLGERVVLSRSRVSRLVDELEAEGLVADSDDHKRTSNGRQSAVEPGAYQEIGQFRDLGKSKSDQ